MQVLKKTAIVTLLLLPVFFLLHNYNELFGFIKIQQVLIYGLAIYIPILVCLLILYFTKKWNAKSSLILFCFIFFFLFFGPMVHLFKGIRVFKINSLYLMVIIYILLFALLIRSIARSANISTKIFFFINIVTICLVATEIFSFIANWNNVKESKNLIYAGKPLSSSYVSPNIPDSAKPDIYFFVFDEYTNNQTLKKIWGFNNDSITSWLSVNGFHFPANPSANYSYTVYSVSSTFNMNYIDAKKGWDGTVAKNVLQANKSLSDNETFSILKRENYSIHFFAPFNNTIQEANLGHFFDYIGETEVQKQTLPGTLLDSKLWNSIAEKLLNKDQSQTYNDALRKKFELVRSTAEQVMQTADSSENRRPNFVYGHFMVPHEPHLFNESREFLTYKDFTTKTPFETYTAQIRYANSLIEEIVSYIKQHNKRNTIIIIEGDHGFRSFVNGDNWFARTPDSLKRYFLPNFNAIYFPDGNYARIYDHISPINTFRVVFDQFYHQNFPMLKDSGTCVNDTFY